MFVFDDDDSTTHKCKKKILFRGQNKLYSTLTVGSVDDPHSRVGSVLNQVSLTCLVVVRRGERTNVGVDAQAQATK